MNKTLAKKIGMWKKADQKIRLSFNWPKDLKNKKKISRLRKIDDANYKKIIDLISVYGYPTSKLVGKKAMKSFWLVIQHQNRHPGLQKACLKKCDFGKSEVAYLTDRILVHENKKQIYGTQFKLKNGRYVLCPLRNYTHVSKLRKSAGLESLETYLKRAGVSKK